MATEVTVTSKEFDGIINPYTGQIIKVKMIVGCGPEPLFHAVDTYSTADLCQTTSELYRLWSRVDGREGLRSGQPKCAYTGEALSVQEVDGQFRFTGGFDPRVLMTREEFIYFATMRDGKTTRPTPAPSVRVTKPVEVAKPSASQITHAESVTPTATQESVEMAATAIEKHKDELNLPTKTGWTGPGKGKGGKGNGKGKGSK